MQETTIIAYVQSHQNLCISLKFSVDEERRAVMAQLKGESCALKVGTTDCLSGHFPAPWHSHYLSCILVKEIKRTCQAKTQPGIQRSLIFV